MHPNMHCCCCLPPLQVLDGMIKYVEVEEVKCYTGKAVRGEQQEAAGGRIGSCMSSSSRVSSSRLVGVPPGGSTPETFDTLAYDPSPSTPAPALPLPDLRCCS